MKPTLAYLAGILGGTGSAPAPGADHAKEDAYYFSHHGEPAQLPVYRVILADGTRYYLDAVSGGLIAKLDRSARGVSLAVYEGLAPNGLHGGCMRGRPQWDVKLVLVLMSGSHIVVAWTGAYLVGGDEFFGARVCELSRLIRWFYANPSGPLP